MSYRAMRFKYFTRQYERRRLLQPIINLRPIVKIQPIYKIEPKYCIHCKSELNKQLGTGNYYKTMYTRDYHIMEEFFLL